ncbi:nitroreductase family protein [Veillonella rodentium]|uniref:F420-0--gamma-glutamyl ligase n=1 Tax=Veillonella rodentium TaxID=248315 RepID=A0A239YHL6_9FIRM|nr:nitroreductase family protein [Veillonella rodentium]SNV58751.1 F420-0--gamma-glutamyl ligase [Veillonella rodentium]
MNLQEVIQLRTSVRKYKMSTSVGTETIEELVQLGMRAPSPKNRQPWQVVHMTGAEKEHFVNLGFHVFEQYKSRKEHFGSLEISLGAMKTASDLLFVYNPYDDLPDYHHVWEKSDLQAIGAFIEHILLGAKEKGIGTLWMNDVYFMQCESKAFLGISHDVLAIIAMGDPDEGMYPRSRKSLEEVLVKR